MAKPKNKPTAAKVSKIDPNETKAAKFSRLGTKRLNVALAKIALIGNLAGPGYEYGPEQVGKIADALNEAVSEVMSRFTVKGTAKKEAVTV